MPRVCPICHLPEAVEGDGHPCGERGAVNAPRRDPLVGAEVLGRYQIRRRLGVGGFGTVYLAHQAPVDRPVALKVLAADASADPEMRQRFLNEARAISRLASPYTVRLIDFGTLDDARLFMVTEFIDGETLDHALRRGLRLGQVVRIADQICQSLHEAHAQGIIHRDLKPQNVMLQRVADDRIVKVLDFGIAKLSEAGTVTAPSAIMGTPQYMSPEQGIGVPVDARSDLYSLGVVLYEMIAGRPPFEGGSVASLLYRHAHEPPRPLTEVAPGFAPPSLEAVVMRLLAKAPEERIPNARALQAALAEWAGPAAGEAWPTVTAEGEPRSPAQVEPITTDAEIQTPVVPPSRRPRWVPAALLLAAAAAGVALALTLAPTPDARRAAPAPETAARPQVVALPRTPEVPVVPTAPPAPSRAEPSAPAAAVESARASAPASAAPRRPATPRATGAGECRPPDGRELTGLGGPAGVRVNPRCARGGSRNDRVR